MTVVLHERFQRAAHLLKSLSHPLRLEMVCGLRQEPCTQTFIAETLGIPQSSVAQHLKVLRSAGSRSSRAAGRRGRVLARRPGVGGYYRHALRQRGSRGAQPIHVAGACHARASEENRGRLLRRGERGCRYATPGDTGTWRSTKWRSTNTSARNAERFSPSFAARPNAKNPSSVRTAGARGRSFSAHSLREGRRNRARIEATVPPVPPEWPSENDGVTVVNQIPPCSLRFG